MRRRPATISPAIWHFRRQQTTSRDGSVASYKRGGAGSKPSCAHQIRPYVDLGWKFPGTIARTTGVGARLWERIPRAGAASSSITRARPPPTVRTTGIAAAAGRADRHPEGAGRPSQAGVHARPGGGADRCRTVAASLGAARRAEGSAASGLADACLYRGEPDGWRAPRGSPGDRVGGGCRPGRQSSVGRGAARGSGRRRYEDPEVPPRAEAGAGGCRGAQGVAGGPGRCAGGCRIALARHRQGIHHGHRYTAGCQAHPEDVPGRLREGWARQGLGASGRAAHVRLAAVDDGMAIEKIARLAGHASSHVTETVYRQELRPVLQEGAEVMDRLFGGVSVGLAE